MSNHPVEIEVVVSHGTEVQQSITKQEAEQQHTNTKQKVDHHVQEPGTTDDVKGQVQIRKCCENIRWDRCLALFCHCFISNTRQGKTGEGAGAGGGEGGGNNWFYRYFQWTWSKDGMPLAIEGWHLAFDGFNKCSTKIHDEGGVEETVNCLNLMFEIVLLIVLTVWTIIFTFMSWIVDIVLGVLQFVFGICACITSCFIIHLLYRVTGTSPIILSLLIMYRGLSRILFIPALWNGFCSWKGEGVFPYPEYHARSWNEFCEDLTFTMSELNPYKLDYLFVQEGKMNIMDFLSTLPIVSIIPFLLRFPLIFVWPIFLCATLFCERVHRPSYCTQFLLILLTCLISGTLVFSPLNWVVYKYRYKLVPFEQRISFQ